MKAFTATAILFAFLSAAVAEDSATGQCGDRDIYSLLDFWVGDWVVYSESVKVGENRIEKILDGCAVMEHWTNAAGSEGKSLFFVGTDGAWKQVWVTEMAMRPGGVKEKAHLSRWPGEGVRFQGELRHPEFGIYLDRTTLIPIADSRINQVIETSKDGGETWEKTFDAIYVRSESEE